MDGLWDLHTHCYSQDYLRLLEDHGGLYKIARGPTHPVITWAGIPTVTLHPGTYNWRARLADPRQAAVDVHFLSTTVPNVYPFPPALQVRAARVVNDDLARWRDGDSAHIRGLASLPMDSDDAVAELERALGPLGLSGVILGTHIGTRDLDDLRYAPVFQRMDALGALVLLHPMVPVAAGAAHLADYDLLSLVGFMNDTTEAVARLTFSGFFDRYPHIRFVLPQLGGAALFLRGRWQMGTRSRIDVGRADLVRPHVYYDCVVFDRAAVRLAVDTVGVAQLVFGSDYPHLGDAETVWAAVAGAGLNESECAAIAQGNARRMLARVRRADPAPS